MNMQFKCKNSKLLKPWVISIWPINRTLSGATIQGLSRPGSDGSEGVLYILQSSSITEISPSDCLVSYQDTRRGGLIPL